PIPERTAGLEPGKIVKWTRRDAILAALEKNVDIDFQRENVRLAQYDVIMAQGYYDPTATSRMLYQKSASPTAQRFSGIDSGSDAITQNTTTYNYGLTQNLERWGSFVRADFNNQRLVSNTNNLSTLYSPQLSFQLNQPLFKNFAIDQARYQIKV